MKKAIITGVTGQDGSYLADLLLDKNYEVHGIVRRSSSFNRKRIEHIHDYENPKKDSLILHYGDMCDSSNITGIIKEVEPDEIYHLAAQSHVKISFDIPEYTADVDGVGTLRLLQAVKFLGLEKKTKIYNAATSELYGKVAETPQTEKTPFYPRSPYGVAKLYAYWICINFREAYNMFVTNGIMFNHESPRRGENFVTRKITLSLAKIIGNKQKKLYLGNLDAKRDWGYAPDYVEAMHMMLQQDKPDDYVIATGEMHSVREFIELACSIVDINLDWYGKGVKEEGIDTRTKKTVIEVSSKYFRPSDVEVLCGDSAKAKKTFGWEPVTKFKDLVKIMMEAELSSQN